MTRGARPWQCLSRSDCCRRAASLLAFVLLSVTANAKTPVRLLVGEVVALADGDTVTVLDDRKIPHKVRLAGIDAPEHGQPFSVHSRQALAATALRRRVSVEWHKTDRFGRLVGKVMIGDVDICLEQIKAGMAWHYKQFEKEQSEFDRVRYAQAELAARNLRLGLWSDSRPIAPWDFRHHRH